MMTVFPCVRALIGQDEQATITGQHTQHMEISVDTGEMPGKRLPCK